MNPTVAPSLDLARAASALLADLAGPEAKLRDDQLAAIDALVTRRERVLLVQATGWGKSAVYWIATRLLRSAGSGPTLVVSPLLALMRNQVTAAASAGIAAATINSANADEWATIEDQIRADEVDVLLISPERLNNPRFVKEVLPALAANVGLLVVDEAHCISDWGHDFRPDYRRISDVLAALPPGVPVLAATATANERVEADVASQIGDQTRTFRGSLDRPSLHLAVAALPTAAHQLAWLAEWTKNTPGPGLIYCLTVSSAEQIARHLRDDGVIAVAYTGSTPGSEREGIEDRLTQGTLDCVVATSALGMGYDNPNLAYVIHLGSPSSPIAYYQQVGRAGRGSHPAEVVLLPTHNERDIWAYFASTAMPAQTTVEDVLRVLAQHGPCTLPRLESMVNLRRGRLEALLKVLNVEGVVERVGTSWGHTGHEWHYDVERYEHLAAARRAEETAMVAYQTTDRCRLRFLREQLDDRSASDCGRCDNCTGTGVDARVNAAARAAAEARLRETVVALEPRKRWPHGLEGRRGNIAHTAQAEEGRALAFGNEPGWAEVVAPLLAGPDGPPDDELLRGVADCLRAWPWGRRPGWVTWIPSRRRPLLVEGLAQRLADVGQLELVEAVSRVRSDAPPQSQMGNSVTQAANVLDAFAFGRPDGGPMPLEPGLVVDDTLRSGWTMTVVAEGLRNHGAGLILPFVLLRQP